MEEDLAGEWNKTTSTSREQMIEYETPVGAADVPGVLDGVNFDAASMNGHGAGSWCFQSSHLAAGCN